MYIHREGAGDEKEQAQKREQALIADLFPSFGRTEDCTKDEQDSLRLEVGMCVYMYMYICVCMSVHVYTYAYTHVYMYVYV